MTQKNYSFDIVVDQDDIKDNMDQLLVLTYLAGYCVYGVSKNWNAMHCLVTKKLKNRK